MQFTDVVPCRPAAGLVPGTAVGQAGTCPRPVARLWRRGLSMLAMALVPLLSAAPEARAELLIGNLNIGTATDSISSAGFGLIAQGFTTGTNASGYTLESIQLFFLAAISAGDIGDLTVTLRAVNGDDPATTVLHTLTNPSSITGENTASNLDASDAATFTAPVGTTLAANTTYFVVVDFDQARVLWGITADGEESGAAGWSIADHGKYISSMTWTDDSGGESYLIRVNGAANAGTGSTGTPGSTDLVPQAWLARFGRTVAEQVVGAVESRLALPRQRGVAASLAGQALPRWNADGRNAGGTAVAAARRKAKETRDSMASLSHWLSGSGKDGPDGRQSASGVRAVTERDLLTGTSFALTMETADGGTGALWGRGAISGFDGQEGALSLDGEVGTAMLGASSSGSALTLGLLMAHSRGNGGYRSADNGPRGKLRSTVTGLYPYVGYRLTPRLNVWGVAGTGAGSLTRKQKDGKALKTDIDLTMAAAGLRGVAVEAPEDGGIELAVKSDAMAVYTTSEAAGGGAGGEQAPVQRHPPHSARRRRPPRNST